MSPRRVAVVTGGGGGIGAAIATELGRRGHLVITMDPLVTVDGTAAAEPPAPEETTAGRIVAAGGAARASAVSVTDREAVRDLFASIVADEGRLDAVVNVAGFSRPTSFTTGDEADWRAVLEVHLDGYRNVLDAALPIMATAGYGRILGVTSGSGWRPADTGAYGCAKRAVAALTWELGRCAPPGVTVNAISPIAMTRMVTAAIERARAAAAPAAGDPARSPRSGGLSLGAMPAPEELGPLAAHLVDGGLDGGLDWCSGRVLFAGGSEVAVVDGPSPLEVVRTDDVVSLPAVLATVVPKVLVPAETGQVTTGGSNARVGPVFGAPGEERGPEQEDGEPVSVRTCVIVSDRPDVAKAVEAALADRGVESRTVDALEPVLDGAVDAVVLARAARPAAAASASAAAPWARVLAEHEGLVDDLFTDASWTRAVADHAAATARPMRIVTLTDARTAGGRSRAQAAAQHARAARGATKDQVLAFAVADEGGDPDVTGEVVAHLLCGDGTDALSGAELAVAPGRLILRSHPRPRGSITFGGPELPPWFDDALRALLEGR